MNTDCTTVVRLKPTRTNNQETPNPASHTPRIRTRSRSGWTKSTGLRAQTPSGHEPAATASRRRSLAFRRLPAEAFACLDNDLECHSHHHSHPEQPLEHRPPAHPSLVRDKEHHGSRCQRLERIAVSSEAFSTRKPVRLELHE